MAYQGIIDPLYRPGGTAVRYVVDSEKLLHPLAAYALRDGDVVAVVVTPGAYPDDEARDDVVTDMVAEMERTGKDRAWRVSAG